MKTLDRIFGALLLLGAIGHGLGSYRVYSDQRMSLIWALSASFAIFLLAALNLLRSGRRGDPALWFGLLIGNLFDFRPAANLIIMLALAVSVCGVRCDEGNAHSAARRICF